MWTFSPVVLNQAKRTGRNSDTAWPNPLSGIWARVKYAFWRIFGCWHRRLSMPFTIESQTYRVCIDCGARRAFDLTKWKACGPFYHPESTPSSLYKTPPLTEFSARRLRVVPTEKEPESQLRVAA